MTTPASLKKTLKEIIDTNDFTKLHTFRDPSSWKKLSPDEQNALAFLFLKKGKRELENGNGKVFESFALAAEIAPSNPELFYEQGKLYAEQSHNIHCLKNAAKSFEKAVYLHQDFFDALYSWAHTLTVLGNLTEEETILYQAESLFMKASERLVEDKSWIQPEFFWHWGLCWFSIAQQAGEASEVSKAIEKFQIAENLGLQDGSFWNDYGNVIASLAKLLDHNDLLLQSAEQYKKAAQIEPDSFDPYYNLASLYFDLHETTPTDDLFFDADAFFRTAAQLAPDCSQLWLRWGLLYVREGRRFQDPHRLELCFEKFLNADAAEPNHPRILSSWAEGQLLYGSLTDDYEQLRAAERKIIRAIEIDPNDPEIWGIYGTLFNEIGRYFNDPKYYYQAIEKFRTGLSLDPQDLRIWYGLATAHYALGELKEDVNLIEKAANYCSRVIDCGGHNVPQFWNDWGVALTKIAEMTNNKFYLQAAIEKFKRAVGWPNIQLDKEGIQLEWVANFASALDYMGEWTNDVAYSESAVQIFSRIVAIDPTDALSHYHLALALSHLAEQIQEKECFERSHLSFSVYLDAEPEDELAWNDWGVTLLTFALQQRQQEKNELAYELFQEAENKLMTANSLGNRQSLYNLACLYSLAGNYDWALLYIEKALQQNCLPHLDELLSDEWLEGLRRTQKFHQLIQSITTKNTKPL